MRFGVATMVAEHILGNSDSIGSDGGNVDILHQLYDRVNGREERSIDHPFLQGLFAIGRAASIKSFHFSLLH